MKKEIKKKWVDALRSGKYRKTLGQLRSDRNCFCALGVLQDLYMKDNHTINWDTPDECGIIPFYSDDEFPISAVGDWAGIEDFREGLIEVDGKMCLISQLNDDGKSFDEIAELIDKQL